jgi:VanZ family protein
MQDTDKLVLSIEPAVQDRQQVRAGRQRLILRLLWVLTCPVVVIGSLLPGTSTPLALIGSYFGDKLLHFASYGWLAFLPMMRERLKIAALAVAAVVSMGLLLELAQSLTPDRLMDPLDVIANVSGIACGAGLGLWARFLESRSAR